MTVNFGGNIYDDAGNAVSGASVKLLETGTTTQEGSTVTSDSDGRWDFSEADQDRYDVEITKGSSVRRIKWSDEISLQEIDVRNNTGNTTPAATFTNLTNNAANQVAVFSGANSTKADGDEIYLSFKLHDSAGNLDEFARMTVEATDVTTTTEDGQIRFGVIVAGTLTDVFTINSSTGGAATISYEVDSFTIKGGEGEAGVLYLFADQGDDAGDEWKVNIADGGVLTFGNDIASAGTYVTFLTLTPHATTASSTVAIVGDATVGDDLSLTSDSSVFNMGAGNDFTITHDGTTGATLAGTPITVNSTGALTLDSSTDITLDADGADVFLKDGGTLFGTFTNSSGELVIKSSSSGTTAATFSGANVTLAGTVGSGAITSSGIIKTDDTTEATSTTDGSLQTDGGLSVAKDAVFGDDVKLLSDSAVLAFGADGDATLTHTNDTGITLNSTNKLMFNDETQFVQGSSNAILSIGATDEIDLTATAVDLNGTLNVSGATVFQTSIDITGSAGIILENDETITNSTNGLISLSGNLAIPNGGTIGVADDTDSITIASGGAVTFSQAVVGTTFDASVDFTVGDTQLKSGYITDSTGLVLAANVTVTGNLLPTTDDTYDLGSASAAWQDIFIEGDITLTDAGTIQASAGGLTVSANNGSWTFGTSSTDQAVHGGTFTSTNSGATARLTGTRMTTNITTQGNTDTITTIAQLWLEEPDVTVGSGDTVTNVTTLYIKNAGTEATNDYAMWVDAGASRFDGAIALGTDHGDDGQQLTSGGDNAACDWTAASSLREHKEIGMEADPNQALQTMLNSKAYHFRYKEKKGTGDSKTEYVGLMADDAPWAMHYKGTIVNPVNTLGYTVLAVQALNDKIELLEAKLAKKH